MEKYYNFKNLNNAKDINGNSPDILIVTSNRNDGKTTSICSFLLNSYIDSGEKFLLLYRYKYEIDDIAEKFFSNIKQLYFQNDEMTESKFGRGNFVTLYLNEKECGYACAINSAEQVKKYSHFFYDVTNMYFDEFESETNKYLPDELDKIYSIHTSIARGPNKQVRRVRLILSGNNISICNPYYMRLGITERLKANTRFLRGDGWVLEKRFNKNAAKAHKDSAFVRAMGSENKYEKALISEKALTDSDNFINKLDGVTSYLAGFKLDDKYYSLHTNNNYVLLKHGADVQRNIYACSPKDHTENTIYINNRVVSLMMEWYEKANMRFQNQICKNAFFKIINSGITATKLL